MNDHEQKVFFLNLIINILPFIRLNSSIADAEYVSIVNILFEITVFSPSGIPKTFSISYLFD